MGIEGMHTNMPAGTQIPLGNFSGFGRGVGQGSQPPFVPRGLTPQQQDEGLMRLYRQVQERASNTTGVAGANVSATAGEDDREDGGEGVDELRRSEMLNETMRARWQARKARRDEER